MKKRIILSLYAFFIIFHTSAQVSIDYSAGYGNYKMGDMKLMLEQAFWNVTHSVPDIPFQIIENFPGYATHTLNISYKYKDHQFGIKGTYQTTGGKCTYADYSGSYNGKIILDGYRLGLNYRFYQPVADLGKWGYISVFEEVSPGITFSKVKVDEALVLFEKTAGRDKYEMTGKGFSLLPQFGIKWFITPLVGIYTSVGYDIQFGSLFKYSFQRPYKKADWSGVRFSGGVSLSFGK